MQLVLAIGRENPTYGKDKIAVILKRDHGGAISASTVGRILPHLLDKGLIQKSLSGPATKEKAQLSKRPCKVLSCRRRAQHDDIQGLQK